jgi:hypothetical protein
MKYKILRKQSEYVVSKKKNEKLKKLFKKKKSIKRMGIIK